MVKLGIFNPGKIWKTVKENHAHLLGKKESFKLELSDYLTDDRVCNTELIFPSEEEVKLFQKEIKNIEVK